MKGRTALLVSAMLVGGLLAGLTTSASAGAGEPVTLLYVTGAPGGTAQAQLTGHAD